MATLSALADLATVDERRQLQAINGTSALEFLMQLFKTQKPSSTGCMDAGEASRVQLTGVQADITNTPAASPAAADVHLQLRGTA